MKSAFVFQACTGLIHRQIIEKTFSEINCVLCCLKITNVAPCYVFIVDINSDFLVSTKCKAIFAVASFRNSSAQFFKPSWCSNCDKLSDSLVNIIVLLIA